MKALAPVCVLLALVLGLFVGRLVWEYPPSVAPAVEGPSPAQLLAELRDVRALLERQSQLPRVVTEAAATAQPLAAPSPEVGIEEFRTALNQALAELRATASSGAPDLADVVVDEDPVGAATAVWEAFAPGKRFADQPDLMFLTARDILRRFGRPNIVSATAGGMRWLYTVGTPKPGQGSGLAVEFACGYVIKAGRFPEAW